LVGEEACPDPSKLQGGLSGGNKINGKKTKVTTCKHQNFFPDKKVGSLGKRAAGTGTGSKREGGASNGRTWGGRKRNLPNFNSRVRPMNFKGEVAPKRKWLFL